MIAISSSLTGCEARLEREPRGVPTLAIVGASYTAGVGPDNPVLSWAVLLAVRLRWNAVVYGVPGAGYANPGSGGGAAVAPTNHQGRLAPLPPPLGVCPRGVPGPRPARAPDSVAWALPAE